MKFLDHSKHIKIGRVGEELATRFLQKNNYTILARNFTNNFGKKFGEIDIIARQNDCIVFVEVKTKTDLVSLPEENINHTKLKKISKTSQYFISKNSFWDLETRFDAISIIIDKATGKYKLRHLKDIFL